MSFTADEKKELLALIIEGVEAVTGPRFDALEADVAVLKSDVAVLKSDMAEVKSQLRELSQRVSALESGVTHIDGRLEAVENDVKDIYLMLTAKPISSFGSRAYAKLSNSQKLLELHKEVRHLAALEGVTLPSK